MRNKILGLLILLSLLLSFVSCKEKPVLSIYETEDAYSYINGNYGNNERHYFDLVIPKNAVSEKGIILYIHGGGWIAGEKDVYLDTLKDNASRGYISASVNYRYADGKKVTCEDMLNDIDAALLKIKEICLEYGYEVSRLLVTGGSAGAHLSLMYAYTRSNSAPVTPAAVVSYAGPTDLTDPNFFVTQHKEDVKKMISKVSGANLTKKSVSECEDALLLASPVNYVNSDTIPTLLCQGIKDDVVPYSNATTLYDLLQQYGVESELISFPNSGHGLEADQSESEYANEMFYKYVDMYIK